ncbi:MAG TPA: TonB-dependent receptor [Acidiferrobacterales bacterium]|nr:TonB-dependent receptor [Acidiferrobacterales bacterium]
MPVANELSRPVIPAARRLFHVTLAVPMFIMALSVPPAGAAEPPLLSEEEFLAELPVVLTASRLAQPQAEAPAAVTVIDRQMIDASGARNLSEVFRMVPGFQVGFENGHRHVVGYHGLADEFSRRLQVLIDGRSVYLPSFGGVSWSDLPLALDDIERIEVIRGPNAVTYGANSFLAIINITTRHSAADRGGFVRATAGSNGIRDGVLRMASGNGDVSYRLTTGYQQDNGYGQRNDSRRITFMNGRMDTRPGERDDIELQFGYNEGPRGRGYAGSLENYPHDQEITSRFQQIRWRHRLDSGDEVAAQFYYNHHESDEQVLSLPIPALGGFQVPINYDIRSERYDAEVQHTVGLGESLRLVWGAGARLDLVEWPGFLGSTEPLDNRYYRLFASIEWRATPRLVLNAGAMAENSAITGSDLSPRLAVNYQFMPGHTLRAGVSSATRQPVIIEEKGNARFCLNATCSLFDQSFYSSGNLVPERILANELGYLGRLAPTLTLDLRLFRDHVTRLITGFDGFYDDSLPDNEATDFRNRDKAMITGSELQLHWQPERNSRVILGYANVRIESNDLDAVYSESAPRNSVSLLGLHELGDGLLASAAFYYQDEMRFVDEHPIGVLRRLDLRLAQRFHLVDAQGEAAVVLQNVLGKQVSYNEEDSIADRAGFLTINFRFR